MESIPTRKNLDSASVISLPTSRTGSFSYHQPPQAQDNQQQPTTLHRCRFTDYTPGSITAIAASPPTWQPNSNHSVSSTDLHEDPSSSTSHRAILAVGRGNGDIQIWKWIHDHHQHTSQLPLYHQNRKPISSSQAWSLYRTLPGHTPSNLNHTSSSNHDHHSSSKIEHLVFAHQIIPSDLDPSNLDHHQVQSMACKLPRLLGSHGADEVIEWVWEGPLAGTIKRTLQMPPMVAIWSLSVSPGSTRLAIGCDDGRIRIANISDDQLELVRVLDPCKTRILSLSWGILDSQSSSDHNSNYPIEPTNSKLFIVAGCADSSLRKWAVSTGRCINRMTVEKLQGEQTLIWSVTVVNGTIVSGDSLGNLHFWDLNTCTRRQIIRAHRADVLCIAASADGQSIFTSGVDQKTCQLSLNIQQQAQKSGIVSQSRWLLSSSRRLHSHDVRALDISPPYNPLFFNSSSLGTATHPSFSSELVRKIRSMVPVLISGGLDMSLVFCPAAPPTSSLAADQKLNYNLLRNPISDSYSVSFADSMQRKISHVINRDPVAQIAHRANLLVCRNSKNISIWHLKPCDSGELDLIVQQKTSANLTDDNLSGWAKVVEMDLKCRTNLISSAISPDGRWLAVSDLYEVKLFYLNKLEDGNLQPRRMKGFQGFGSLKNPKSHLQGARLMEFSADSVRLVLAGSLTSDLVVLGLDDCDRAPSVKILRVFYQHSSLVHQHDHLHRPVITPASLLTSTSNGDGPDNSDPADQNDPPLKNHFIPSSEANTEVYVVKMVISPDGQWLATADSTGTLHIYNMDALKHHCYLPIPSHLVNSLVFPPSMPSVLLIGFANNTIQVIDVESRKVPDWAKELNGNRPECLADIRDSMIGMVFQPLKTHVDQTHHNRAKSESNASLQNDNQSMTIDGSLRQGGPGLGEGLNGSPIGSVLNDQLKHQSSIQPNKHSKVSVGLIWGANWVCKMTIPDPNQPGSELNQHPHPPPSLTRTKRSRFSGVDHSPKFSPTIEESAQVKTPVKKPNGLVTKLNRSLKSSSRKNKSNQAGGNSGEGCENEKMSIDDCSERSTTQTADTHGISLNKILAGQIRRSSPPTFDISHKYQSILAIDYLHPDQLVIVERPFFSLISDQLLAPAWHRVGAYGT